MRGHLLRDLHERLIRHASRKTHVPKGTHPILAASVGRADAKVRRHAQEKIALLEKALEASEAPKAIVVCDGKCGTKMKIYDFGETWMCGVCKKPMRVVREE